LTVAKHITVGGLGATVIGTPQQVADEFERWIEDADVDGFNIAYALKPGTFVDVIELLLPELRKRGIFWDDYAVQGGTYRENLRVEKGAAHPAADHPAARYQWRSGVSKKDAIIPPEPAREPDGTSNGQRSRLRKRAAGNGVAGRRKSTRLK
jgi:hypothetical protein